MKNSAVKGLATRSQAKYGFDYTQARTSPPSRNVRPVRAKPKTFRERIHELVLWEQARTDCKHDYLTRIEMNIKAKVERVLEKRRYREAIENYEHSLILEESSENEES